MSATLLPVLRQRFFDENGAPLAGGQLFSYLAGTTTPAATMADSTGNTPNTNPVILDADGYADVWLGSGTFKFVLKDANNVVLWSVDNVVGNATGDAVIQGTWVKHSVTDGQSASDLDGETVDSASYTSAIYQYEIARGTTVFSTGSFSLQYRNSTWQVVMGQDNRDDSSVPHGVTFSKTGTTIAQLQAALTPGAGDGTIKLNRQLVAK